MQRMDRFLKEARVTSVLHVAYLRLILNHGLTFFLHSLLTLRPFPTISKELQGVQGKQKMARSDR